MRIQILVLSALMANVGCGAKNVGNESQRPPCARESFVEPFVVEVTGGDYEWRFRYPGPDHLLHTKDDFQTKQHVRLPAQTRVRLEFRSEDFIYTFSIPERNLKKMAIPELEFSLDYRNESTGVFDYRGDQMCGFSHPTLMGTIIVLSPEEFSTWARTRGDAGT